MSVATEITRLQTAKADIKAAIEEKGVIVGDGTIDTYAEKINEIQGDNEGAYEEGLEAGKKAQYDAFWDTLQNKGDEKGAKYTYAFAGVSWTPDRFKPKYKIIPDTTLNGAKGMFQRFNYAGVNLNNDWKEITYDMIDLSNCTPTSIIYLFDNAHLNYVEIDLSNIPELSNTFNVNDGGFIYNIRAKINASKFVNTFAYCHQLKTLILEEGSVIAGNGFNVQWATKLSKESIESIITALSEEITTACSITLPKAAVITHYGEDYDNNVDWINLISSKSNQHNGLWTISLI